MAVARLGLNGEIEVIVPPTAAEQAEAQAALLNVARLLGRIAAEEASVEMHRPPPARPEK